MLRIFLIIFLFLGITLQNSFAEYRVFVLRITKKTPPSTAPTEDKTFLSTLDPEQYKSFHPLAADETISYTETWRCYGRTGGGMPFCPNPKAQPTLTSDQASSPETNIQNPTRNPASPP